MPKNNKNCIYDTTVAKHNYLWYASSYNFESVAEIVTLIHRNGKQYKRHWAQDTKPCHA